MRIVLQRVSKASVTVEQEIIGQIDQGLLLLVGFGKDDESERSSSLNSKIEKAINKICHLRVFSNAAGKLDLSVLDVDGAVLTVPQFTLYGQVKKGRRPDFIDAMAHQNAKKCFEKFVSRLINSPINIVQSGQFGADMKVELINDGPFSLLLEY